MKSKSYYVEVNGVIVGQVSGDQMKFMVHEVRVDWRTWFLQLGSVARAVMQFVRIAVYMLVVLCTIGPFLVAYFDSASLSTLLSEMSRSSAVVDQVASRIMDVWAVMCTLLFGLAIAMQNTFGLEDHFSIALSEKLRHKLDVPADGNVRWWPESRQTIVPQ